ncbi:hypothetical protein HMPREF0262_00188 [Clostridium sp. ATCC 29733]|nr:hypothetical protein HMPREF0262_00188 [Clostridium sp. ATCC 29733]
MVFFTLRAPCPRGGFPAAQKLFYHTPPRRKTPCTPPGAGGILAVEVSCYDRYGSH